MTDVAVRSSDFEVKIEGTKRLFLNVTTATYHREKVRMKRGASVSSAFYWIDPQCFGTVISEVTFSATKALFISRQLRNGIMRGLLETAFSAGSLTLVKRGKAIPS